MVQKINCLNQNLENDRIYRIIVSQIFYFNFGNSLILAILIQTKNHSLSFNHTLPSSRQTNIKKQAFLKTAET